MTALSARPKQFDPKQSGRSARRPIQGWPRSRLPQERLFDYGASVLSDAELLAIFIRSGLPGHSATDVGRSLLARFGSLRAILSAPLDEALSVPGLGKVRLAQLLAAKELGIRCLAERLIKEGPLDSPQRAGDYLRARLQDYQREVFVCLYLDTRHRVLGTEDLFVGTLDGATVHPREVVRAALLQNAAAVIVAHNHPSGIAEPSQADIALTGRLAEALALVDVRLLDHLIVGEGVVSLAARGHL